MKNQIKNKKKMTLNRETVRQLSAGTLTAVAGGAINLSRPSQCPECASDAYCPYPPTGTAPVHTDAC